MLKRMLWIFMLSIFITSAQAQDVHMKENLTLQVLKKKLAICRLESSSPIPSWALNVQSDFLSITKTADELSIVCEQSIVPKDVKSVKDWVAFKVEGPLDFALTGILSSLLAPLATEKISIFAISTYDTDYILVQEKDLEAATLVLKRQAKIISQ